MKSAMMRLALRSRFVACGALLACLLGGCLLNATAPRVSADHAATIKRVGVLSLLEPVPAVNYLSTSAQESSFAAATLDGWQPARLVHERVGSRLRSRGFEVVAITPSPQLIEVHDPGAVYPQTDSVNAQLYEEGVRLGVDMIVIAYPQVSEDFVTGTNQNVRGYGIQRAFDTGPFAYANVYIEAIDVKRRFVAAKSQGRQSRPLDPAMWQAAWEARAQRAAIPPDQHAAFVTVLTEQLGTALGVATQEAGF